MSGKWGGSQACANNPKKERASELGEQEVSTSPAPHPVTGMQQSEGRVSGMFPV